MSLNTLSKHAIYCIYCESHCIIVMNSSEFICVLKQELQGNLL